ncbi:phosphoadenosine phosphosulfate reductase family protein [Perilla frutescens var. hirtella]|uniref:Phosphoadenosine phosphosulfate reductase family protein n=1 Tax=Perilla frutescens var. hirtella TaxID=608512 RepID=A0AAD4JFV7_PERFH|nr:phosphoadenosine phosphosulfate reductase family protein [Perilla frutescens var. hirtella]
MKSKLDPFYALKDSGVDTMDSLPRGIIEARSDLELKPLWTSSTASKIDSVADEVEREKSMTDMVFIFGAVGPLPSDVTVAGVAKAFGVRLISLHGGQVRSWKTERDKELLFTSSKANLKPPAAVSM